MYASCGLYSWHSRAPKTRSLTRATVFPARRWVFSAPHRCVRLWKGTNCSRGVYFSAIAGLLLLVVLRLGRLRGRRRCWRHLRCGGCLLLGLHGGDPRAQNLEQPALHGELRFEVALILQTHFRKVRTHHKGGELVG